MDRLFLEHLDVTSLISIMLGQHCWKVEFVVNGFLLAEISREKFGGLWVKVFRIIPDFRILRLTFYRKSASKC